MIFLLAVPWHENVWVPWCTHLWWLEGRMSQHGIYAHVTLSKCSYDSAPIMTPDKTTPENILHFQSIWHDLFLRMAAPLMTVSSCDGFSTPPPLLFIASISWWILLAGCLVVEACDCFRRTTCYLLPADKAMNSSPKWNSYCYQKHKIPITLDVRAQTRKWNKYS